VLELVRETVPAHVEMMPWELLGDARAVFFGSGALRGDAWEGLIDDPGTVFEAPSAVFETRAAVFAAGADKSDVGDVRWPEEKRCTVW
jgi:hypothetical protein